MDLGAIAVDLPLAATVSATTVALIFGLIAERFSRLKKKQLEESKQAFEKALSEAQDPLIEQLNTALVELPEDVRAEYIQRLVYSERPDGSFPELTIVPPVTATKEEIGKLIDKQISTLQTRIEEIENRFPSKATLEKISSVNDAILATKVENLAKSIEELNRKLLTKWDVAKVVFLVIGGLGGLLTIIFVVIKYLPPTAGP